MENTQRVLTVPFEAGVEPDALSIHLASGQLVMFLVARLLIARRRYLFSSTVLMAVVVAVLFAP